MKRLHRPASVSLLTALIALATAGTAMAQTYRIVGPDGKVTYSDRKPTDPQLRTRQLGQVVTSPLLAPSAEPYDLRPARVMPPLSKPFAGDAVPLDAGGLPFPAGMPEAVLDVLVHQFFVQSLVETCGRLRPALIERYQGGVRNWRDRNAEILARSNNLVFTRFTGEQRDTLRATARARLAPVMPPADASAEDRMQWCDRMSTDLALRRFELVGDARVTPILSLEAP